MAAHGEAVAFNFTFSIGADAPHKIEKFAGKKDAFCDLARYWFANHTEMTDVDDKREENKVSNLLKVTNIK